MKAKIIDFFLTISKMLLWCFSRRPGGKSAVLVLTLAFVHAADYRSSEKDVRFVNSHPNQEP